MKLPQSLFILNIDDQNCPKRLLHQPVDDRKFLKPHPPVDIVDWQLYEGVAVSLSCAAPGQTSTKCSRFTSILGETMLIVTYNFKPTCGLVGKQTNLGK